VIKPRPNHGIYLEILRRMTPEQRLRKTFELSEMGRELFRQGLRQRHPDLSPEDFEALLRKRLSLCHNRNY
jgi:DNA-binding PadR family transcriptional regulator